MTLHTPPNFVTPISISSSPSHLVFLADLIHQVPSDLRQGASDYLRCPHVSGNLHGSSAETSQKNLGWKKPSNVYLELYVGIIYLYTKKQAIIIYIYIYIYVYIHIGWGKTKFCGLSPGPWKHSNRVRNAVRAAWGKLEKIAETLPNVQR